MSASGISPSLVYEAAERIRPIANRTPLMRSRSLDERGGIHAYLKCENFQRGGAFKIRGASNLIFSLRASVLERGVVAFSSGNHAQAVAIAAKYAGASATLVMPFDAPKSKLEPTRALGAKIVFYDRQRDNRELMAQNIQRETGGTMVPPYDHPLIIAGQGTTALELLQDAPPLDALVVCVGGGGLMAGCATIAKSLNPAMRIFGAEPELANDTWQSIAAGHPVEIAPPETIADGLRSTRPGQLTFPIVREFVEQMILISEQEIRETVKFLLSRMKIVVEPSGAVAVAAVLFRKLPPGIRSAGVIISGGNVDLDLLATL